MPFTPRWRGADLATLLDERHAAVVREVTNRLVAAGWAVTAEVTFAVGREIGSIDVLGWRADCRALLLVEVKSELADLQDLLAAFDRKRRLAGPIARERGMRPLLVGAAIVPPEETQARNSVRRNDAVLSSQYPARGLAIRRWLDQPRGDLRGIWFLPISNTSTANVGGSGFGRLGGRMALPNWRGRARRQRLGRVRDR